MKANEGAKNKYWIEERELGGVEGPVCLMLLNLSVGLLSLRSSSYPKVSLSWNAFIALTGALLPVVWQRFVTTGLENWPLLVILLWFFIFWFEVTAFITSATWCAITTKSKKA